MKYFSTILLFLGILNENFKEPNGKKKKRRRCGAFHRLTMPATKQNGFSRSQTNPVDSPTSIRVSAGNHCFAVSAVDFDGFSPLQNTGFGVVCMVAAFDQDGLPASQMDKFSFSFLRIQYNPPSPVMT
jgi:hypothetical protein